MEILGGRAASENVNISSMRKVLLRATLRGKKKNGGQITFFSEFYVSFCMGFLWKP